MAPADKKKLVKPAVREPLRRPKKPKVKKEKVVKKEEPPKPKVKKPVNPRHFRPRKRHEPKRLLKLKKKDEREVPARFLGGRLFAKAIFTGYKRGQRQQHEKYALLRVEGCKKKKDLQFYVGKKCIFVYKVMSCVILFTLLLIVILPTEKLYKPEDILFLFLRNLSIKTLTSQRCVCGRQTLITQ